MRMRFGQPFRIILIAGAPLSACSSGSMIVSDHLNTDTLQSPLQGLPYFLPKAVLSITIAGSDGSDAASKTSPAATPAPASATPAASAGAGKTPSTAPVATATASPQVTVNVQTTSTPDKAAGKGTKTATPYKGSPHDLSKTAR